MKMMILDLPLIGKCDVVLKSNLAEYTKRQFTNYFVSYGSDVSLNEKYEASLYIYNLEIINIFKKYMEKNISLSRNTFWNKNSITVDEYIYTLSENVLTISVIKKRGIKTFVKQCLANMKATNEEAKYALLGGRFYQEILFPLLTVYAAGYGFYCVHGSLIHLNTDENIILSGLDGVGKSTLSDLICKNTDNVLLADNIVLFNGIMGLNLNLAMRLEITVETEQEVIYSNKDIKEIVPPEKTTGLVPIDRVLIMLKGNSGGIEQFEKQIPMQDWIMFVERAPEIGHANRILSYWMFMHTLVFSKEFKTINIKSISIPNGKLKDAKELI